MRNTHETSADEFTPVIVGIGQLLDRPADDEIGMEPLALIIKALEIADSDSQQLFLKNVDSIDIENITSRSYSNISDLINQKLKLSPSRSVYHEVSGDLPIRNLCEAANRIANGTSKISVICGGEATWSVARAKKRNISLDGWEGEYKRSTSWIPNVDDILRQYDLQLPVRVYALYENACRSKWKQSFAASQQETGEIQSRASIIASMNKYSWSKAHKSVEEIITPSAKNKMITWPYTKLMVANNKLNNGTAIILTNLRLAKELGFNLNKVIYLHAGGYASEPDNILRRDCFTHSSAMEAVFERLFQANNIGMSDIDYNEIYSCFPSVTKIAKRIIQPAATQDLSVTGGMTFCRGQLSNFMSQALITMVTKLRLEGRYGLLYGNGHYLTHAAGIIISKERPAPDLLPINLNVQPAANAKMSEIPELVDHHQGSAQIETYTVVFDKENNPAYAIIIARNNLKQRFLAITNKYQESEILPFLDTSIDPIGRQGQSTVRDGYNMWTW